MVLNLCFNRYVFVQMKKLSSLQEKKKKDEQKVYVLFCISMFDDLFLLFN